VYTVFILKYCILKNLLGSHIFFMQYKSHNMLNNYLYLKSRLVVAAAAVVAAAESQQSFCDWPKQQHPLDY